MIWCCFELGLFAERGGLLIGAVALERLNILWKKNKVFSIKLRELWLAQGLPSEPLESTEYLQVFYKIFKNIVVIVSFNFIYQKVNET